MSGASKHPRGLPYIVGNEAAERFSYYGMKSILIVFMTSYLRTRDGIPDPMTPAEATFWYHLFGVGNYLFPLFGALVADIVWGKYRTIILLSIVYCVGHLILALDDTRAGLLLGLTVIAIGSGGIKPCVSAHLGDQYVHAGSARISQGYSLFYLAINVGALLSTILIPRILASYGPSVAFLVPGIFMACATIVFWLGRHRYARVAPTPWRVYCRELSQPGELRSLVRVGGFFCAISVFWSLFDQIGSSWVLQAEKMERVISLPFFGSFTVLPAQIQAINPFLIITLTPLFTWLVYPALENRRWLSVRGKVMTGMLLASASFVVVGVAQYWILQGYPVSIGWQCVACVILTTAEVLVSVTTLELAYTHAPQTSKSLVMSLYLLSVALGNGLAATYNGYLTGVFGDPESVSYFLFFAALPVMASVVVGRFLRMNFR